MKVGWWAWTYFQGWKCVHAERSRGLPPQPDGLGSMARDMRGSGGSSVANLDSRNPQISSFFCPLCEEAGRAGEIGCALGSHCGATTNDQFRGFFGTCETVSLQTSEPRVAGSSPAGCISNHLFSAASDFVSPQKSESRRLDARR